MTRVYAAVNKIKGRANYLCCRHLLKSCCAVLELASKGSNDKLEFVGYRAVVSEMQEAIKAFRRSAKEVREEVIEHRFL